MSLDDLKEATHQRVQAERAKAKADEYRQRALQAEHGERVALSKRDKWRERAERAEWLTDYEWGVAWALTATAAGWMIEADRLGTGLEGAYRRAERAELALVKKRAGL